MPLSTASLRMPPLPVCSSCLHNNRRRISPIKLCQPPRGRRPL
ncbi:hypothetical protein 2016_scaffold57_00142 [Bacteriophage sp.]|nr:hypothetical protein 2016_scaffold57_00142 [Bacteriophage sp.]